MPDSLVADNRHYLNGSGVAAGDVDGDGLVDLYFARLNAPNKLYKNLGNFQFEDITRQAGVAHEGYESTGVVLEDVDGDADLDLLVTSLQQKNVLYLNDGNGQFTLKKDSGLGASHGSSSMAMADIDGDGDLDLYITNYKIKTARDIFSARELRTQNTIQVEDGEYKVLPPFDEYYGIIQTDERPYRNEYGTEDELYINEGDGTFQKVKGDSLANRFLDFNGNPEGLSRDWGLTAKFQDINGDGHPDLYVCNDFWTPDRVWINRGDGIFRAISRNAIRHYSFSSMGVDVSDINRDGHADIFVSEMLSMNLRRRTMQFADHLAPINGRPQYNKNSLYINRGDTTFAETAWHSGLEASEWSWATHFMDVDLDGYEDLIIATGNGNDYQDLDTQMQANQAMAGNRSVNSVLQYPTLELSNIMFQNNRDGTFRPRSAEWGFEEKDITHGLAFADFDNDGDLDFASNRFNREAAVFSNQSTAPRIAVRLKGKAPNSQGIGAKIMLKGGPVEQSQEVVSGGDYLSDSQTTAVFAADEKAIHTIVVEWPDGTKSEIDKVQSNRIYEIEEPAEPAERVAEQISEESSQTIFSDVSNRINHTHNIGEFNDFELQPLLPKKLSYQGPGISWIDTDRDGDDDLLISGGTEGLAWYENMGNGQFKTVTQDLTEQKGVGVLTTVLGWAAGDSVQILAGNSGYTTGSNSMSAFTSSISDGQLQGINQAIPGTNATSGPVAAADYDQDGDLDFFVGGRFRPGRYPENASSQFIKMDDGRLHRDRLNTRRVRSTGLVTGAVFSDYDRDGDPDLLLSRAWDSILLLENDDGIFKNVSADVGLAAHKGWWNGIATGDFNNDGRPDIVATNIGTNSIYQLYDNRPLKMYYSDFNMDGRHEIIEAQYSPENTTYTPMRRFYEFDSMQQQVRHIQSHEQFANATLQEIFNRDFDQVPSKELNTLQHILFVNTTDGFEPQPLPSPTQWTAAFYAGVADYNNDGNDDLFLSQNVFDLADNRKRLDAGRGRWLKGDGEGNLLPVPGNVSGIKIYGQQRGAALSDFNGDGKVDLAVSQNGDRTKLYQNQTSGNGLRVQLKGSPGNQNAVGSGLRAVYENGTKGPYREVQAGSGYRSQNSAIQVMGGSGSATQIEVQWFDGTTQTVEISASRQEMVIEYPG